jgi:hypothetical protein
MVRISERVHESPGEAVDRTARLAWSVSVNKVSRFVCLFSEAVALLLDSICVASCFLITIVLHLCSLDRLACCLIARIVPHSMPIATTINTTDIPFRCSTPRRPELARSLNSDFSLLIRLPVVLLVPDPVLVPVCHENNCNTKQ